MSVLAEIMCEGIKVIAAVVLIVAIFVIGLGVLALPIIISGIFEPSVYIALPAGFVYYVFIFGLMERIER